VTKSARSESSIVAVLRTSMIMLALIIGITLPFSSESLAQSYLLPPPLQTVFVANSWCFSGTCDVATPIYVNVYWDIGPSQWNADIAAAYPFAPFDMTVDRIDALTNAIVHSQYFSLLSIYSVTSVLVLPSIFASQCGAPPATINGAISQFESLATCILQNNPQITQPGITIMNVLLPPQTGAATGDFCTTQHAAGEHIQPGPATTMTVLPTNNLCNASLVNLFHSMTHEMVEATTDPDPSAWSGWVVPSNVSPDTGDEIADVCESFPWSEVPGTSPNSVVASQVGAQPFLYSFVSTYFAYAPSPPLGNCVPIPPKSFVSPGPSASAFGSQIVSAVACGSGASMKFGANVAGVGPVPWDLPPGGALGGTLYLNGNVSEATTGETWSVGNLHGAPPDPVQFGSVSWTSPDSSGNSVIAVFGFSAGYGSPSPGTSSAIVHPGDSITLNIFDTNFGQAISSTVTAELPQNIIGLNVVAPPYLTLPSGVQPINSNQWYVVGINGLIPGYVVGNPNCGAGVLAPGSYGIQGVSPTVTSNDPSDQVIAVRPSTNNAGFFEFGYTPSLAGTKVVTATAPNTSAIASTTVNVHPAAFSVTPGGGPIGGNQSVTLTGAGYIQGRTAVSANAPSPSGTSKPGTGVTVSSPNLVKFTTPASPLGQNCSFPGATSSCVGQADIIASVGGLDSIPINYNYVVPGQPQMTLLPGNCSTMLEVDVYDANDNEITENVNLSASAAVLQQGRTAATTTATVPAGGLIRMTGKGPVTITATPVLATTETLTERFSYSQGFCFPGWEYQNVLNLNQLTQFGPVGDQSFVPQKGQGTDNFGWIDPSEAGNFVEMAGVSGKTAANDFSVSSLSIYSLRSLVRANRSVFIQSQNGRAIQFTGSSIRISETKSGGEKALGAERALDKQSVISFKLPNSASETSDYRILHLISSTGIGAWKEVTSLSAARHQRQVIRASITETGVYALAVFKER
jgi:hypothetical protein